MKFVSCLFSFQFFVLSIHILNLFPITHFEGHIKYQHFYSSLKKLFYLNKNEKKIILYYFIEYNKNLVPFFIDKSSIHRDKFLRVKFEDVDTELDADNMKNLEVYLPLTMLPKLEGTKFYFHEIIGFKVTDQRLGDIGTVHAILDNAAQPIFEIFKGQKQVLVPMIDSFIIEVNRKEKELVLNTPIGLVDLYLE